MLPPKPPRNVGSNGDNDKFRNLVLCTEDVYNAKVVLKNPKNNRKINFKQKKLIVKILEHDGLVINTDGEIISKQQMRSEIGIKNLESAIIEMSQQLQSLQQPQSTSQAAQQSMLFQQSQEQQL